MAVTDPETLTVTASATLGTSEVWANVIHVLNVTGNAFDFVLADLIQARFEDFWEVLDADLADQWTLTNIRVEQETSGTVFDFSKTLVGGQPNPMPFQTAVVVSLSGNPSTRSTRGRFYLSGLDESYNDDGLLLATAQTLIADEAETLGNALITIDTPLVVWSELLEVSTPVVRIRVGRRFDSQRRRANRVPESYTVRFLTP